jgi:hypothetical protein
MEDSMRLTIADLEAIKTIVETKVKELRLVDRSKGPQQTPEQEHKLVSRVLGDTIQIMLSYIEPQDAAGIFKSVYGTDTLLSQESLGKGDAMDSDQVMRYI